MPTQSKKSPESATSATETARGKYTPPRASILNGVAQVQAAGADGGGVRDCDVSAVAAADALHALSLMKHRLSLPPKQ